MRNLLLLAYLLWGALLPQQSSWAQAPADSALTVLVEGQVTDRITQRPLAADLNFQIMDFDEAPVNPVQVNPATGTYQMYLLSGVRYRFTARAQGFESITKVIDLRKITQPEVKITIDLAMVRDAEARRLELADPFGTLVTIVYFRDNGVELTEASQAELRNLLRLMRTNPELHLWVHGHADTQASFDLNYRLSELRTQAVRAYLLAQDIAPYRLPAISYGNTRLLTTYPEDRHLNDRVEFHLSQTN